MRYRSGVVADRMNKCKQCEMLTKDRFCIVYLEYMPEKIQDRKAECPLLKWKSIPTKEIL